MWGTYLGPVLKSFDERKHPRYRRGDRRGGQFMPVRTANPGLLVRSRDRREVEDAKRVLPKFFSVPIRIDYSVGKSFRAGGKRFDEAGSFTVDWESGESAITLRPTRLDPLHRVLFHEYGHALENEMNGRLGTTMFDRNRPLLKLWNGAMDALWNSSKQPVTPYAAAWFKESQFAGVSDSFAEIVEAYYSRKLVPRGYMGYDDDAILASKPGKAIARFLDGLGRGRVIPRARARKGLNRILKFFNAERRETAPENAAFAVEFDNGSWRYYLAH